ncbi:MAG: ABC transporter ATP-binding protein [Rhodococcus sp. (in: high G+C Gram-positive bacteria)]
MSSTAPPARRAESEPLGDTLLQVQGLRAGYGSLEVLHGLDFSARTGDITVILGPNGAGKTTITRALAGLIPVQGKLLFNGSAIGSRRAEQRVRDGISLVPQGRGTLSDLTVEDNLRVGAYTLGRGRSPAANIAHWYELFPILGERRKQLAGTLSGGEQQMLAVARALMSEPTLLLLDEPSLGLAPLIVRSLYEQIAAINADTGTTMLVVEQNAKVALAIASHAFVLEAGHIVASGRAKDISDDDSLRRAYLGF